MECFGNLVIRKRHVSFMMLAPRLVLRRLYCQFQRKLLPVKLPVRLVQTPYRLSGVYEHRIDWYKHRIDLAVCTNTG